MKCSLLLLFAIMPCCISPAQGQDSVLGKFYALDELPAGLQFNPGVLRRSAGSVGKFDGASGVIVEGGLFITARHVAEHARKQNPKIVRVQAADGTWQDLTVAETALTIHSLPYDAAIYRIIRGSFRGRAARIRPTPLTPGERVFGIGVVWDPSTKETSDQLKVTIGTVADLNTAGRSFCEYTNEDNVAIIENWRLEEPGCLVTDYSKFKYLAREERDPLLIRSPMSFGMSGSPLFDKDGLLAGIGSNVLSSTPLDYDASKFAVYVKALNVAKLLAQRR